MTARLNELLRRLQAADGIDLAAVVSMEGQIIDVVAREDISATDLGAVAANGMLMMRAMGHAMGRGEPVQAMIEYQEGLLLLEPLDRELGLIMMSSREANLGRMRLVARKYGQDLLQAASVSMQ